MEAQGGTGTPQPKGLREGQRRHYEAAKVYQQQSKEQGLQLNIRQVEKLPSFKAKISAEKKRAKEIAKGGIQHLPRTAQSPYKAIGKFLEIGKKVWSDAELAAYESERPSASDARNMFIQKRNGYSNLRVVIQGYLGYADRYEYGYLSVIISSTGLERLNVKGTPEDLGRLIGLDLEEDSVVTYWSVAKGKPSDV